MSKVNVGGGFNVSEDVELNQQLIVGSKVSLVAKNGGEYRVGAGFFKALSEKVHIEILQAQHRCKNRGGKTLGETDL